MQNLQSYVPINITALEASIDALVANSFKVSGIQQDLIEINDVMQGIGSDQFLKIYADVLADMFKDIPSDYFAGEDFFNPAVAPNLRITSLRAGHLREDFDSAVSFIRSMVKAIGPNNKEIQELLALKTNTGFIKRLGKIDPAGMPESFGPLQEHIRGFYNRYQQLKGQKNIDPNDLKGLNTNLQNVTGQIFWEAISLEARKKALEILFNQIHPGIKQAFFDSGGRVIAEGHQTGTQTNQGGKQEVSDSLITLSLINKEGSVVATITMGDSTKLSGSAASNKKFFIEPTKTQADIFDVKYLLGLVDKIDYWENRLKVYLDNSQKTSADEENWNNTRLGFYLKAMYDVLAVRATQLGGQYAQTLTVNNKVMLINNVIRGISNYYQTQSKGRSGIRSAQNDIFNMGGGYEHYVVKQQKISRGVDWSHQKYILDEPQLEANYKDYIKQVMATKINISSNVLF